MHKKSFINEAQNIALNKTHKSPNLENLITYEETGDFWGLLDQLKISLAVSREYEHFLLLLGSDHGKPWHSAMEIPHPSGLYYDNEKQELIVSSTRTPNQIFFFKAITSENYNTEIVPRHLSFPGGTLFLPYRSVLLPGDFRIHDVILHQDNLYATITEHNFLAKISPSGSWERIWSPKCVDNLEDEAFVTNYLQLNSLGISSNLKDSYLTAFSDKTSGYKPWKEGYGPKEKGVVFSYHTREVVCRRLTCPHSAKIYNNKLWLCNSGYGEIGVLDQDIENINSQENTFIPITKVNGFTRGLALLGDYCFIGLSKVIDFYEPYAPGLIPEETICAILAINLKTGEQVASLKWPNGYQIYDIQIMPNVMTPFLPHKPSDSEINIYLRYLG